MRPITSVTPFTRPRGRRTMMVLAASALTALTLTACSSTGQQSAESGDAAPAPSGEETATSQDTAYVINTGGVSKDNEDPWPSISVVDRATGEVTETIALPDDVDFAEVGHFANLSADGTKLWLGNRSTSEEDADGVVRQYDVAALHSHGTVSEPDDPEVVDASFGVGSGVQNVRTPDGRYVFTSSEQGDKGINVFDTQTGELLGNIPVDNTSPHSGAVSPDGSTYYTTTAEKHHVVGYDITGLPEEVPTDSERVVDVDLGYGSLHAFDIDSTGRYLFVGNSDWQIPEGSTPRSGVSVIDLQGEEPEIVATVPGRPHNFAISPDGKYLASTELKAQAKENDCDAGSEDLGNRLQFVDISTLTTDSPDFSTIEEIHSYETPGLGGSHPIWDDSTGWLYYTLIDNETQQGWLDVLDTSGLADGDPSVDAVRESQKIGWNPHGLVLPDRNGR